MIECMLIMRYCIPYVSRILIIKLIVPDFTVQKKSDKEH